MTRQKKKTQASSAKAMAETANIMSDEGKITAIMKDGKEVEIFKCRAKNIGRVMDFIGFVMVEMNIENFGDMPKEVDFMKPDMILPLLTKAASRIIYLSADLCDLDPEDVENLELDDMITLVTKQFEVNKGFFLKSVLPRVGLSQPEKSDSIA